VCAKKSCSSLCVCRKNSPGHLSLGISFSQPAARECVLRRIVRPERIHCLSTYCVMIDAGWLAGWHSSPAVTFAYTLVALLPGRSDLILFNQNVARFQVTLFTLQISSALAGPTCVDIQISDCGLILKRYKNKYPAFYWNMCF
jgi:hypothetical protein